MTTNQNIVPHLWYDKEAKEAAEFYASIFPDSRITSITPLDDTPSGDSHLVSFELWGQKFLSINAGPIFKFNPSVSFMVNFDPKSDKEAIEKINMVWSKLSEGGTVLTPLDKYSFSDKYGWIQDKYGLSWQLILKNTEDEERPTIMPSLMFGGDQYNKAEEALQYYLSVFNNAKKGSIARSDKEGAVMFSDFMLENQWLTAMDSAENYEFRFSEAISLTVYCDTQEEIDHYWNKLSAVPESEQCGWLKDKYGMNWQIVPREKETMMTSGTPEQVARVTQATLKMKKLDLAELQEAYKG
ncbi:VOC family protein [Gracilibacillus kekensis]|uniref:Glyoxalase superfamily enzyme, possibly 3-demethylubiquinone-9 3-methyltransferase n=1 Tax=Gracilibacillus kekensis TaxID=1027249 RepID=A0A1M7LKC5_9BACI|nr:VOC family protein [Gracilibacillus kekensis]SHM78588.1 Glyoxalase superfamily enzyme, possibly 3-demethylubiquinone-9 3-methyltransferase [Gracilibacillus kekensis]